MNRVILASLSLILAAVVPARAGEGALEFAVFGDRSLSRVDVQVTVERTPLAAVWGQTFACLFAFFDRNDDGVLDEKEAGRLPSPLSLRQAMGNGFTPPAGRPPAFGDLDRDGDHKVTAGELAAFYRGKGVGDVVIGVGRLPAGAELTAALLKSLDPDGDGKVTEKDWRAAVGDLGKLDANDDELIGAGELVAKLVYPGAAGTILMEAGRSLPTALEGFPVVLLPADRTDTRWLDEAARRTPGIKRLASAKWREDDSAGEWIVPLGVTADCGSLTFTSNGIRVAAWGATGRLSEATASARRTVLSQLESAPGEPEAPAKKGRRPGGGNLSWLIPIADRDGSGKLDRKELDAWLDLQGQVAKGEVLLTILDGGGLFELMDTSRDGALSVRELRTSWNRVNEAYCVVDGVFHREKLPRVVLAVISRGYPRSLSPVLSRGPAWSQAMDRNRDGDVSRREFTGTAEKFDKLDADKDGLIDAEEASRATPGGRNSPAVSSADGM